MIFQQGSLRQSYLIGRPLYKQAKLDSVILLVPIQNTRIELWFTPLWPVDAMVAYLAGIWLRKSPCEPLNAARVEAHLTCLGRQLLSLNGSLEP